MAQHPVTQELATPAANRQTVVGLFDDHIDAEQALLALRKADRAPEQVSLVIRDRAAEREGDSERHGAVARALVANALEAVGGWLQGLASLIVPERGTYLVAGPLGAALAGISAAQDPSPGAAGDAAGEAGGYAAATEFGTDGLLHTLTEFGFAPDEARYIEQRLAAGAALIAVTSADARQLQAARRLFGQHNAVHLGQAETDERVASEVDALLAAAPEESQGGDVVVTDAVAPLRRLCSTPEAGEAAGACGAEVVDPDGEVSGTVEELLADAVAGTDGPDYAVRYVVVGFGGILGLGRHHVAVPSAFVDLAAQPVRVAVSKGVLQHAPDFDPGVPFSRREELVICAYFGCPPYWQSSGE